MLYNTSIAFTWDKNYAIIIYINFLEGESLWRQQEKNSLTFGVGHLVKD
jgi:hypothetical protein